MDRARQLIQNVIDRANQRQMQGGGNQSMGGSMVGGAGDGRSITYDYMIPAAKCGLVIGKQGETIKLLQVLKEVYAKSGLLLKCSFENMDSR